MCDSNGVGCLNDWGKREGRGKTGEPRGSVGRWVLCARGWILHSQWAKDDILDIQKFMIRV